MTRLRTALLAIFLIRCTSSPAQTIDVEKLKGAWWKEGEPSFTWLIMDRTILMEFDMKEHPYRLEGNVLIIDFEDPTLGVQRKRILRLTDDELEFKDEQYEKPKGFSILLNIDDPVDAERIFNALAENGTVRMPIQKTFWAVRYGGLVDQFGIPWEINCEQAADRK